ncbi:MAG: amino acid ABC transporter permease [Dactylosporangium sp.]|nr:amino acid ABC transporter permease [Dactylosporangium sp.]NNJ62787.1 amino acid ABC transporter permease [Dactylosporangium sp.]
MTVLYDAPGPRARRRTVVISAIAAVLVVAGGYRLVYQPLADQGQFSAELWGPLLNPGNEQFSLVWRRILEGFQATLIAAGYAIVASLVAGTALAVLRVQLRSLVLRRFTAVGGPVALLIRGLVLLLMWLTRFCVEVFRGIPVVITIFFVWVALPEFGITFETSRWYLVIGLSIYNAVVIGEVLRSGMEGLPGGQREAAHAVGLTPFQTTRLILLPQAFRIMLPALISQLVVVLKDTSLGFIISYEEALRVGSQVVQVLENPIQVYTVIGAVYILVNYGLSKLAQYIQRRQSR